MIRRPLLVIGVAVAAAFSLSSCSTLSGNDDAARVGDARLSRQELATIVRESDGTGTTIDELQGDVARASLTKWIRVVVLETENGVAGDQAASTANLDSRLSSALDALASKNAEAAAEQYAQGPAVSGVICLGAIPLKSVDQGQEVLDAIAGGSSFADAAKQYSSDPGLAENGGIITSNDGSECVAADTLLVDIQEQASKQPVGTPFLVVLPQLSAVLVVRPFDTLNDEAKKSVALITNTSTVLPGLVGAADVRVDSRYGRWNSTTGEVVAFGG